MTDALREILQRSLGSAYTLDRELGGGGMSRVFLAQETAFGRQVVLKVLPPDLAGELSSDRFAREVKVAARLQDPHIVPVLTAGDAGGLPYYTMPYVAGDSLRERLRREPKLTLTEGVEVLRGMLLALAAAHEAGVVHRDIKPENVLLSRSGTAVVTDFGIAKAVAASRTQADGRTHDGTLTRAGASLGTPAYMAPEQATGDDVDHRADLYAWGVVAYEVLAGRHPFASKTTAQQLIAAHIAESPKPLEVAAPSVSRALAMLVMDCLAKNPGDRPASAAEVLARFDSARTGEGAIVPRRSKQRGLMAAAVLGIIGIAAALALWRGNSTGGPVTTLLPPTRVVVATLANRTGDASLDPLGAMAADWIARGLASTGLVDVAGTANDIAARDSAGAIVAARSLAALAATAKAGLVISGAYYRQGDSIVFEADFTDANAGKRTRSVGPVAAAAARPMDGVERLRQRVTAGLATMLDTRLGALGVATSQPPNMEAYQEFLAGEELFYKPNPQDALPHYARANALDSGYVYPLLRAMFVLTNLRRYQEADSIGRIVLRRAAQLSAYERAYLDQGLATSHSDPVGAYEAARAMVRAAPKSAFPPYQLAVSALGIGKLREADSLFSSQDPTAAEFRGRTSACSNWVTVLHGLGAFERILAEGARRCPTSLGKSFAALPRVQALSALGREAELSVLIEEMFSYPEERTISPENLVSMASLELRAHGHIAGADRVARRLVAWHDSSSSQEGLHRPRARTAALFAARDWNRLQPLADSLAALTPTDIPALGLQGVAHAMRGDRAGAERIAATIARVAGRWQPRRERLYRGAIAAALGDKARAVELLRQANPPSGFSINLLHFNPPVVYEALAGYPPFDAMLRPAP